MVFGYPNPQKIIEIAPSFKVTIENGAITKVELNEFTQFMQQVAPDAPKPFQEILDIIRVAEKEVTVR